MNRRNVVCSLLALFLTGACAQAGTVNYHFWVDTSGIAAAAPSGGWIDFQFNQANSFDSLPATATIDGFVSSGYLFGAPDPTGVAGTLPGPIDIPNNGGAANYFTQGVDSWGDGFGFFLTLSGDAVGTPALDGSTFFVYLLDPNYNQIVSPPTSTGEIVNVTIDTGGGTTPQGSSFTGGSATVVPEPGAFWLALPALAIVGLKRRRRIFPLYTGAHVSGRALVRLPHGSYRP